MSTNQQQKGDIIDVVAGGTITSGSVQNIEQMVGVALKGAASGETYPLAVQGVFEVTAAAATYAVGEIAYITEAGVITNVSAVDSLKFGHFVEAKVLASPGLIKVRLSGGAYEDEGTAVDS